MNRNHKKLDSILSRIILIFIVLTVGFWLWSFIQSLVESSAGQRNTFDVSWVEIIGFCKKYITILLVAYGFICVQISGIAELKYEKNFLKAFMLSIILTPPVMMAVYGHGKKKD
tara:strand:- start:8388 stop:8729 length:342 start_codon:yes stop_codon:yes gene_type:complete